jgi:YHS domain-containing protein
MKKIIIIQVLLWLLVVTTQAQDAAVRTKQYNLDNGLAIQGYDPVAYFTQQKAVKGSAANALHYQGVTYYFVSNANKEVFKKDPSKFEPQYGGWCAYAMGAKSEKVSIDPKTFKITDGKLYLFYNKFFNNTLTDWNKDEASLKNKADGNWKKISGF